MIIPGPLEMKNSTQNTPPWQFSELYHLCNNNLKNDLFASPLFQRLALSIQKGNAALILSRSTDIHHFEILGEY